MVHYHGVYGNSWAKIARKMTGRSPNSVKNRLKLLERRKFIMPKKYWDFKVHSEKGDINNPPIGEKVEKIDDSHLNELVDTFDCQMWNSFIDGDTDVETFF